MKRSSLTFLSLFCCSVFNLSAYAATSHTGIGSGGDVVEAYLAEVRARVVEGLNDLVHASSQVQQTVCQGQGLDSAKEQDCAAFLLSTAKAMAKLHTGPKRTNFELSLEPVMVTGADGLPHRVAARTLTGPDGPITFDYSLILRRSPKLLLALVTHETGHKVAFPHPGNQGSYIGDDEPVLHFQAGHALLDAAGLALGNFAEARGIIGTHFTIRDKFYCEIKPTAGGAGFYQAGDDDREFSATSREDRPYDVFWSGIGPGRKLEIGVVQGETCLSLQIMLNEASGCSKEGDLSGRHVDLQVVRMYKPRPDGTVKPSEILKELRMNAWNPACEDEVQRRELPMAIDAGGMTFSCTYKGMAAATEALERREDRGGCAAY